MSNGRRNLSGDQQSAALRAVFPAFRQIARGNPWAWEGKITPIGASTYRVRVAYYPGLVRPQVTVLDPVLVSREAGVRIPHTFKSGRICLHVNDEWNPSMYLHATIVPWANLWLYYYEVWHAIGEWLGGGHSVANDQSSADPEAERP